MINLPTQTDPPGSEDDSASGEAMSLIFTGAVLIVTGAVALLAVVGTLAKTPKMSFFRAAMLFRSSSPAIWTLSVAGGSYVR